MFLVLQVLETVVAKFLIVYQHNDWCRLLSVTILAKTCLNVSIKDVIAIWHSSKYIKLMTGSKTSNPVMQWSFRLRLSTVNMTKSVLYCGFGHIYWRNY